MPPVRPTRLSAYPLWATPQPWPVSPDLLEDVTGLPRIRENVLAIDWGDHTSRFAPIFVDRDGAWVAIRLARLSQDSLERVDVEKLKEELLSLREGQYFAESAHLLIDTSSGLSIGEYKPEAVGIVGDRPASLLNHALRQAKHPQRVEFHPFPSPEFREVVLGKAIKRYTLKLGPASASALEEEGFSSEAVRRIVERDHVVGVDITITVEAGEETTEKRAGVLEGIARKLSGHRAKMFRVTTEDHVSFDLLRHNLTRYDLKYSFNPHGGPGAERKALFEAMKGVLVQQKDSLLKQVPKRRTRSLTEFGDAASN